MKEHERPRRTNRRAELLAGVSEGERKQRTNKTVIFDDEEDDRLQSSEHMFSTTLKKHRSATFRQSVLSGRTSQTGNATQYTKVYN